ncbi:MAG: DNA-formamidopyrimidine glycosylase, partial [Planctomycetia bacterium]|nr:DNA-formamidopyrimidine glycosylase [Planctomycetia bacterium]
MPELPEVETMVRGLRPALVGRVVDEATVHDVFLLQTGTAEEFKERVSGSEIGRVDRRGKWVVITLSAHKGIIVIQPRMTGGFWLVPPAREDHVRMTFRMSGPVKLVRFCDNRRLGKIAWYGAAEDAEAAFRKAHGPDALEISREELAARLKRTGRAIKPTLMDQKVLAGVGNIYADEILFRAGIHPERRASRLQGNEVKAIHTSIGRVLNEAIAAEGSSFDAGYRTVLGLEGGFLGKNAMYGRGGQPCPNCGGSVLKTKMAGLIGRPTHYCPSCQPLR